MTRDKELSRQMSELLDRWAETDQTLKSFAATERQSYWKLVYWKKKLGKRRSKGARAGRSGAARNDSMVPVRLVLDQLPTGKRAGARGYLVRLRTGIEVEVPQGFDAAELSRLFRVIEPC